MTLLIYLPKPMLSMIEEYMTKKKGMTISKAVLLMFASVFMVFLVAILLGIFNAHQANSDEVHLNLNTDTFIISFLIFSLIGYFSNGKELPYFIKTDYLNYLIVFGLAITWYFLSMLLNELFKISEQENVSVSYSGEAKSMSQYLLVLFFQLLFLVFHIGIIGHGLLRNYPLKKIIFIVGILSVVLIFPSWVLESFFSSLLLMYLYYLTKSFQLCLLFGVIRGLLDILFMQMYTAQKVVEGNFIRDTVITNSVVYFFVYAMALFSMFSLLYFFKKINTSQNWQRAVEYENFEL